MAFHISRHESRQQIPPRGECSSDGEVADPGGCALNRANELLRVGEKLFALLGQSFPRRSELHAPSVPDEEPDVELFFEQSKLVRHVRLRHAEHRRGLREVPELCRHSEDFQFSIDHRCLPNYFIPIIIIYQ